MAKQPKEAAVEKSEKKPTKKVAKESVKESDIKVKVEKKPKAVKKEKTTEDTVEKDGEKKERKPRRVVDREIINQNIDKIIEGASNMEGKQAKSILKELKVLRNDLKKVMKKKGGEKKRGVTNSGFFKEVKITEDLAKFMQCSPNDLKSRVDVTRFICKYVKDKNLQDSNNKKIIVPDDSLKKLLKHDTKTDGALTFPSVQKLIQKHFIKA